MRVGSPAPVDCLSQRDGLLGVDVAAVHSLTSSRAICLDSIEKYFIKRPFVPHRLAGRRPRCDVLAGAVLAACSLLSPP